MPAGMVLRWARFYRHDRSEERADRRAAIIAYTVARALGGKKAQGLRVEAFHAVPPQRRPNIGHGLAELARDIIKRAK